MIYELLKRTNNMTEYEELHLEKLADIANSLQYVIGTLITLCLITGLVGGIFLIEYVSK